jgi:hypothetical protein
LDLAAGFHRFPQNPEEKVSDFEDQALDTVSSFGRVGVGFG